MKNIFSIYKIYFYIVAITFIVGIAAYSLNQWHYYPINVLKKENTNLMKQLKIVGSAYNICEANLTAQGLQGFIDGIGEKNETIVIDFSNANY